MLDSQSPVVSVIILTYEQERFIAQAIESVLAQKVNFDYEIIIGEDCSQDHTDSICQEYSDKYGFIHVLPRTQNLGVTANWCDCVQKASGKYLMMLDGDDYWTDTSKMQLQVDFMEHHPECVLCHTGADCLYMKYGCIRHITKRNVPEGNIQQMIMSGQEKMTGSTICYRTSSVIEHIPFDRYISEHFPCEDWPTIVILSGYGEIRYLPVVTTVYRVGHESITNQHDYDKIRSYWVQSRNMKRCLHDICPSLGVYDDDDWFDHAVYNALLNAAYRNNDFPAAKEFARKNLLFGRRLATLCAKNLLMFKLYRLYYLMKK